MSGLKPKKSLGQHFLLDPRIIKEIINRARFRNSDTVIEIGPGKGALTIPLSHTVGHVVAVEKDSQLTRLLKKKLENKRITNVTLINRDVLKWDFNEVRHPSAVKVKVIGNLPYNISTPFLARVMPV